MHPKNISKLSLNLTDLEDVDHGHWDRQATNNTCNLQHAGKFATINKQVIKRWLLKSFFHDNYHC